MSSAFDSEDVFKKYEGFLSSAYLINFEASNLKKGALGDIVDLEGWPGARRAADVAVGLV